MLTLAVLAAVVERQRLAVLLIDTVDGTGGALLRKAAAVRTLLACVKRNVG